MKPAKTVCKRCGVTVDEHTEEQCHRWSMGRAIREALTDELLEELKRRGVIGP